MYCSNRVDRLNSSNTSCVQERERARKVVLKQGSTGLGFSIIGGDGSEGIYVSFLLAGGAADLSGEVRRGDQILTVNGHDLRYASHSDAVSLLKQSEVIELICRYQPEEYYHLEAKRQQLQEQLMEVQQITGTLKTTQKRTFYIRALFDYDPHRDSGLPSHGIGFRHGDILHVTNASDDEWWQARKLTGDTADNDLGIIPGKKRVERKEKSRLKNVKFVGKDVENPVALTIDKKKKIFSRRLFFTKTKDRSRSDCTTPASEQSRGTEKVPVDEAVIFSYETVIRQEVKFIRPVIILGPLKERLMQDLVTEFPEKFAVSIPHTTRPKADDEVDGRDYHFVASREQMEHDMQENAFIEAGQFSDHFYGTSIQAVRDIAEVGKHCLLDVGVNAIKKLQTYGFYPIVMFIKPRCIDSIMEWNKRMAADQARTLFEQTLKVERDFRQYFTTILTDDAVDDIYVKLKEAIDLHSTSVVWIPSKEKL